MKLMSQKRLSRYFPLTFTSKKELRKMDLDSEKKDKKTRPNLFISLQVGL